MLLPRAVQAWRDALRERQEDYHRDAATNRAKIVRHVRRRPAEGNHQLVDPREEGDPSDQRDPFVHGQELCEEGAQPDERPRHADESVQEIRCSQGVDQTKTDLTAFVRH